MEDDSPLFGQAKEEIDDPIEYEENGLSTKRLEDKERERKEKRYFSAFKLIIGCLVFLGLIFLIDTFTTIAFGKASDTKNSIIEIVKTLLFTLSGYLFGRSDNSD